MHCPLGQKWQGGKDKECTLSYMSVMVEEDIILKNISGTLELNNLEVSAHSFNISQWYQYRSISNDCVSTDACQY
jgi:hypothetical protein